MISVRRLEPEESKYIAKLNALLQQLRPGVAEVSAEELQTALKDEKHFQLFVAEDDGEKGADAIVGMATAVYFWRLTGPQVEIHDVILAEEYRGQGIGQQLMERAIEFIKERARIEQKQINIKLTSRPDRVAGNALYKKLGFTMVAKAEPGERGTNLYELKISPK